MSPRRARVTVYVSPPPESPSDDPANEQLLAESQASASRAEKTSAIHSANLLNAVRVGSHRIASIAPHSSPLSQSSRTLAAGSPVNMGRHREGAGKLKRPSFLREDLARMRQEKPKRRGDVYAFQPESPEHPPKAPPVKLPQPVDRKPLKRAKKGPVNEEPPKPGAEPELSTPPPAAPTDSHAQRDSDTSRRKSGRLTGDEARISHVDFAKVPGSNYHGPTQSKRKAEGPHPREPSKSPRVEGATAIVSRTEARSQATRNEPRVVIPAKEAIRHSTSARKRGNAKTHEHDHEDQAPVNFQDEVVQDADPDAHATAGHQEEPVPEELPLRRTKSQRERLTKPGKTGIVHLAAAQERDDAVTSAASRTRSGDAKLAVRSKPAKGHGPSASSQVLQRTKRKPKIPNGAPDVARHDVADNVQEDEPEADKNDAEANELEDVVEESEAEGAQDEHDADAGDPISDLNRVFKFLDFEERSGKCTTTEGKQIKRACRAACELIAEEDTSIQDVSSTTEELRAMLAAVRRSGIDEHQSAFKVDAYGYLFRAAVKYLEMLYDWLTDTFGDILSSFEAMSILTPFVREILALKDAIASWKVGIPQRYKDDCLVKDVDIQLIVPLRKVNETFRAIFSQLKAVEKSRGVQEELIRKRKERVEELKRKQDALALRDKKWKVWQDLHVWRLQCEPGRLDLFIDGQWFAKKLGECDERDSTGMRFERLQVFKQRVSPARPPDSSPEVEWTNTQESALLDGLQRYAGPEVFKKIFEKYCPPGRPLRDFNVAQITSQAATIRAIFLREYPKNGWEVPKWVVQIPVLP